MPLRLKADVIPPSGWLGCVLPLLPRQTGLLSPAILLPTAATQPLSPQGHFWGVSAP